ncbi:hypothetical protein NVIE_1351 [Nitrososphaera viennensis EN76]|uniref:Uncharacterized protein n=1 Tax=Nitrososphaera viennensis EN76 TaxID=926571 RepID=A0A060HJW2_9ARCH|nr:hypothetical protein NVIE_1351 [Nitrososphaera viennensis EN76]
MLRISDGKLEYPPRLTNRKLTIDSNNGRFNGTPISNNIVARNVL